MDRRLILDRYRPLEILGEGGHGTVTLAFDTRIARRVAIKSIPLPDSADARRSSLAEARTIALLDHPAIVTLHEWDTDEHDAHAIMEYVDGTDLGALLDEYGPFDIDTAAAVLAPVAEALTLAHENGVLHLDVKPENVLVTRDGRIKVADFGIAMLTGSAGAISTAGGTLGYMPLEQLHGEELGERTDQWAFAALAFEMLTDANPFEADTVEGAIFKAEYADVPAPSEFEPDLPPAVDDILLAALDPEPDQRYPSIFEMAMALFDQLGDPRAGRDTLVGMVTDLVGEESDEYVERLGLWDRTAPYAGTVRRLVAALLSGWLGWSGLQPLGLGMVPVLGAALLIAVAGAGAPALGLALGLLSLSIGFFTDGLVAGIGFLIAGVAFWLWIGRTGRLRAFSPFAAPLFGILHLGLAPPLLLGAAVAPLPAAAAAAWTAGALHLASAMSGQATPYLDIPLGIFTTPWIGSVRLEAVANMFSSPGPLVSIAGWALTAAVVSLFARAGTRGAAAVGVVMGTVVLLATYGVWGFFDGSVVLDSGPVLEHVAGSLILMAVVIGLGAPARGGPT